MTFYLIDDDILVIKMLENLIEEEGLGEIAGFATDPERALSDLIVKRPDIVLVDLLMPGMDGNRLIERVREANKTTRFIMISQVSSKDLVQKAYDSGVSFFIHKPINRVEVTRVVEILSEKMTLEKQFNIIKGMVIGEDVQVKAHEEPEVDQRRNIEFIFSKLGIMGEKGCGDISEICDVMIEQNSHRFDFKVSEICAKLSDNPRAMEQRIRRAINKGLANIANVGLEDYMNENFMRFSNSLYDFENVKAEMDFIRGKRQGGGKINVKRFIENLLLLSEDAQI